MIYTLNMIKIAKTIKQLREQAELSQTELAKRADLSIAYISKLEAGKYKNLSLDVCHQLASGLDMTLRALLERLDLLEDTSTPNATLILKEALRGSGYTKSEAKTVINYGEFLKSNRNDA